MAAIVNELPLVVVVGPTASGKTALAIRVALGADGEIICGDSRTVFREMNIGTAKPTADERQGVVHWGLDLVSPGDRYTAAAWQAYARERIKDIRSRGKLPIVAGGTGLYIDGLIFDYQYPTEPSVDDRLRFEGMSQEELYIYCLNNNIELPENDKNKRHLIRHAMHAGQEKKSRDSIIENSIVVGIATDNEQLRSNIAKRTEQMFADGVVEEARSLGNKYGWDSEAMTGNIYPLLHEYIKGSSTVEQVKEAFRYRDRQLAKRQMTWFRRNPYVAWGSVDDCEKYIVEALAR